MTIRQVLLTGDDGYNSIGIRLVANLLKSKYKLVIAGTKTQQSGVGGKLSVFSGGTWGITTMDKIPALWVSGTPADAIECARSYYQTKFDLVISGINLGLNVSDPFTSGTMAAAWRSLKLNLSPRAIAISWNAPSALFNHPHHGKEELKRYLDHPGKTAGKVIDLAIDKNFWGSSYLNINLPEKVTAKAKFGQFLPYISDYYPDINLYKGNKKRYTFPHIGAVRPEFDSPHAYDAWLVNHGFVSITPCSPNLVEKEVFLRHAKDTFKL